MFVWMAKFGAAYGVRTGIHVGVDVLINRLDDAHRAPSSSCSACWPARCSPASSARWARTSSGDIAHTDQISADLEMPMWIVYLAVPLGSYLMCFRFLQVALVVLRTGELPHHDHAPCRGLDEAAATTCIRSRRRTGAGDERAIIFGLLLALMLTGMPISISLGLTVLTFLFTMTQVPIESVALKLFTGIEKFEIMAIPFFILAGNFLTHGGVARRMINFATSMVGHWHGGLALAGVMACALFAAVSGSSPATVVAIGSIMLPAMVKQGFPKRFGAGVITTSGALGILIPPSIVMVIYAVSTNTSVGALFMAGVVPGLCWPRCSA